MAAKILFVSKDIGGSKVLIPVALANIRRLNSNIIVTEGLASDRFEQEGLKTYFKGTVDFQKVPFTIDAGAVLDAEQPNLVVVSVGYPIHLELEFAARTQDKKIPLVAIEDYWGISVRLQGVNPSCILTLDEYGKHILQEKFPDSRIEIVGNSGISKIIPKKEADEFFDELKSVYEHVYAFVGGYDTERDVGLLMESLKKTNTNWCLVPRLHPKCEKVAIPDSKETYGDLFKRLITPFGDRVRYAPRLNTDEVVVCADVTLSTFSTMLATAAYAGKTAVSIQTLNSMTLLKKQAQLDEVPVVALGCAHKIEHPADVSRFGPCSQENRSKLKPYDCEAVFSALTPLL